MKNLSYFLGDSESMSLIRNRSNIRTQSENLSREQMRFLDGCALGDIRLKNQDQETLRNIRRIIEKRVCQEYWKTRTRDNDNFARFNTKRFVSNHIKNLYGPAAIYFV